MRSVRERSDLRSAGGELGLFDLAALEHDFCQVFGPAAVWFA